MDSAPVISLAAMRARRRLRLEREAWEAKRERHRREDSERLARLLGWDNPPPGGHAA